jgi:hypothetical protein
VVANAAAGFEFSILRVAAEDKLLADRASGKGYASPYLSAALAGPSAPAAATQGAMEEFLTPETVLADLRHTAIWGGLDDEGIARLAHHALFFAGRGHAALNPLIAAFYPEYAARVADTRRDEVFARIRALVQQGLLRPGVFLHFLCHDPALGIAAAAAREVASLALVEEPEGVRGADWVLKLVVTGSVVNSGAALGGVLTLGDPAINAKLAVLRAGLALPWADRALGQMASCATGYVFAATVEFWLEWLEALVNDLPEAGRVFDWAARALVVQRDAMIEQCVLCDRPATRERPNGDHGPGELSIAAFAESIGPRLRALLPAAPRSELLLRAVAAWSGTRHAGHGGPLDDAPA